jgi:hypothetical protein
MAYFISSLATENSMHGSHVLEQGCTKTLTENTPNKVTPVIYICNIFVKNTSPGGHHV